MFYLIFHATLITKLNWQLSFVRVSYLLGQHRQHAGGREDHPLADSTSLSPPSLAIPSCHTISVVGVAAPAQPRPLLGHEPLMMFLQL